MRHRAPLWTVGLSIGLSAALLAQQGPSRTEWRAHGGDSGSRAVRAARPDHEGQRVAPARWRGGVLAVDASLKASAPDLSYSHDFHATPLMIDGVLYSSNGIGLVEAFHPGTGKTTLDPAAVSRREQTAVSAAPAPAAVAYWSERRSDRRIFAIRGEYLDRARSAPAASRSPRSGDDGRVNLQSGLGPRATNYSSSSGPQVCGDVVMVGAQMSDAPQTKGTAARRRAGIRRADRQAAMDVPRHPADRAKSATRPGKAIRGRYSGQRESVVARSAPTRSSDSRICR